MMSEFSLPNSLRPYPSTDYRSPSSARAIFLSLCGAVSSIDTRGKHEDNISSSVYEPRTTVRGICESCPQQHWLSAEYSPMRCIDQIYQRANDSSQGNRIFHLSFRFRIAHIIANCVLPMVISSGFGFKVVLF